MKKRILSIFLAVCFVFVLLPFGAYAASSTSGTCGTNLKWTLKGDTLTVSGTGKMTNYSWGSAPWSEKSESIANVVIKDGVTSIGNYAFVSCINLKTVTIADTVQKIGNAAFQYCSELTSITLPAGLKSIGKQAFYGCTNVHDVNYSGTMAQWGKVTVAADEALISAAIIHCTDGDVDNHSGTCGDNATWDITDGVLTISGKGNMGYYGEGEYAPWIYRSASITSVVIKKGITEIGSEAFAGCGKITSVSIPTSVKSIGYQAFWGCESLETIEIPGTVKTIEPVAFLGCGFKEIVLPEGVKSIGYLAFTLCEKLETVSIPASVTEIGWNAFKGCKSLKAINVATKNEVYYSSKGILFEQSETATLLAYPEAKELTEASPAVEITTVNGKPKLSWNKIDGADSYVIYRSTDGINFDRYTEITKTSYTDTRAKAGTEYYYVVGALDEYYEACDYSAIKSIQCKPATPTISITRSAGKPKISWNAVSGATKYFIYRSTDGENYKYLTYTTKTSYTNSNATIGTQYYYKVKAVKTVDGVNVGSDFSNVKSVKCLPATPSVTISRVNGKPKLSWKAVTGASKYYIYRSTDGKTYKYLTYTTKTSYNNTNVKVGTKYYYKVKAVAAVNETEVTSLYSGAKSLLVSTAAPVVKITTSNGDPKISWSKVTGATKYYIYRSTDGKTYKYYTYTTKTAYTDTKAKAGTKYYYKVKAVAVVNKTNVASVYSNAVSVKAK